MKVLSERRIVVLISSVQFINVLDFMMVMPMGPDLAKALSIQPSKLGLIGGSYTAAAAVAGVVGSFFLDRFDRRKVLFFSMMGLMIGTILGGLATNLHLLLAARVLAGIFGGPATSVSLSIVADVVAPSRRGRAMGAVMGAFSIASIAGVPLALECARLGGWRMPFFAIGGAAFLITIAVIAMMPPMQAHLDAKQNSASAAHAQHTHMFRRSEVYLAFTAVALSMLGAFLMIPNISTFFQFNLGYPREHLGMLYFVGGIVSFFVMRIAGRMIDRFSAFAVVLTGAAILTVDLVTGYILSPPLLPPMVIFTGLMMGMSIRGVVLSSLTSRVPRPAERARYMSFQSAVQHIFCSLGAVLSTAILHETSSGALTGMPLLATFTGTLTLIVPFLLHQVEKRVRRKEADIVHIS